MPETLTALIHGPSGIGKSWLGQTTPTPRLVIDAEGRAHYPWRQAGDRKIFWDPVQGGPPEAGDWDTCIVRLHDYNTMALVYQWLRSGQHPFVSVTLDSLMEIQKRCVDMINPSVNALGRDDYGELLRRIEKIVREYRDLVLVPACHVNAVVVITGSELNEQTGQQQPLLLGAIRKNLPYYIDVVGYYHWQPLPDGSQQRSLLIHNQPGFIAKDATDLLPGPIIPNPNIIEMMGHLRNGVTVPVPEGAAA